MSTDILQFVPLLHGDEIRAPDARRFLHGVHVDPGIRAACLGLGYMSLELPEDERKDRFKDCLSMLMSWEIPAEPAAVPGIALVPEFVSAHRHFLPGAWRHHVHIARAEGTKRITAVVVTTELAERIEALQNFWGLRNHAVVFNKT